LGGGVASSQGAHLLQVHPLERTGRAREYALVPPDDLELSYAFIEVARLSQLYRDRMRIQFDVADRELIERQPWRAFAQRHTGAAALESLPLAEIVSPIVVQDDGWVVPSNTASRTDHAIARLGEHHFARRQRSGNASARGIFSLSVSAFGATYAAGQHICRSRIGTPPSRTAAPTRLPEDPQADEWHRRRKAEAR